MPNASHTNFCPQCGATQDTQDAHRSIAAKVSFRCGEEITVQPNGHLSTSYTCKHMGAYVRKLEDTLADAVRIFPQLKAPSQALSILEVADAAYNMGTFVALPKHMSTRMIKTLARDGMIESDPVRGTVRITEWGHKFYQHRKETTQ